MCTEAESTSMRDDEERDSVGSISGGAGARFFEGYQYIAIKRKLHSASYSMRSRSEDQKIHTSSAVCFGPFAAAAAYDIFACCQGTRVMRVL